MKKGGTKSQSMETGGGQFMHPPHSRVGKQRRRPYPHLSQSRAKAPDRSGQPFLQSPPGPVAGAPQAGFMHLLATAAAIAMGEAPHQSDSSEGPMKPQLRARIAGAARERGGWGGVAFRWMWRGQRTQGGDWCMRVRGRQGTGWMAWPWPDGGRDDEASPRWWWSLRSR